MYGFVIFCRVLALWLIIAFYLGRFVFYVLQAAILIPYRLGRYVIQRRWQHGG